jgi:hypothetical protein
MRPPAVDPSAAPASAEASAAAPAPAALRPLPGVLIAGRSTAALRGELVVFVIGLRINRLLRPDVWLPVAREMGPMLAALAADPRLGLLSSEGAWAGRVIRYVQVWRSFGHLERFARGGDQPHLAAWGRFMKRAMNTDVVGIFHETYLVPAGAAESVYVNMPLTGLGAAAGVVALQGSTARGRLGPAAGAPAA